jgi:SAM-dependent methyltransferase
VALDRSESAIRVVGQARSQNGAHTPTAVVGDMCALPIRTSSVDAIINMWQSFGQFDSEANRRVLAEWARGLRPGGRLVLDLYHRAYHERNVGTRRIVRDDVEVMEVRSVEHGRLRVTLTYVVANTDDDAGKSNEFEWQLYSPGELADAAAPAGLNLDRVCTEFDVKLSPTNESPRMQVVFVKAA